MGAKNFAKDLVKAIVKVDTVTADYFLRHPKMEKDPSVMTCICHFYNNIAKLAITLPYSLLSVFLMPSAGPLTSSLGDL